MTWALPQLLAFVGAPGDAGILTLRASSNVWRELADESHFGWPTSIRPQHYPIIITVGATEDLPKIPGRGLDEKTQGITDEVVIQVPQPGPNMNMRVVLAPYKPGRGFCGRREQTHPKEKQLLGARGIALLEALGTLRRRHGAKACLLDTSGFHRVAFGSSQLARGRSYLSSEDQLDIAWKVASARLQDDPTIERRLLVRDGSGETLLDHTFLDRDAAEICTAQRMPADSAHRELVVRLAAVAQPAQSQHVRRDVLTADEQELVEASRWSVDTAQGMLDWQKSEVCDGQPLGRALDSWSRMRQKTFAQTAALMRSSPQDLPPQAAFTVTEGHTVQNGRSLREIWASLPLLSSGSTAGQSDVSQRTGIGVSCAIGT